MGVPERGRNTVRMPGINNWDVSLTKRFSVTESKKVEFRAYFFNLFNRAQYVPGSISTVRSVDSRVTRNHLIPGHVLFGDATQVFASNSRSVQLALRIVF